MYFMAIWSTHKNFIPFIKKLLHLYRFKNHLQASTTYASNSLLKTALVATFHCFGYSIKTLISLCTYVTVFQKMHIVCKYKYLEIQFNSLHLKNAFYLYANLVIHGDSVDQLFNE